MTTLSSIHLTDNRLSLLPLSKLEGGRILEKDRKEDIGYMLALLTIPCNTRCHFTRLRKKQTLME